MLVGADNDFSNKKVREKLGFKPIISYQQALHEIENYVQTQGI